MFLQSVAAGGKPTIYKNFSIPRVPEKYQDPIKQAEYAYSLIQSEVSG